MTDEQSFHVSVIDPITPAIEKVKAILFAPFDLNKWFVIGFCAWLAYLGQRGFNCNFHSPFKRRHHDFEQFPAQIQDFIMNNLPLVIIVGSIALVLGIVLWIVLFWLSSRGKFMFLHCVAQDKAEVVHPWHKFQRQGNSLFLFRIAVSVISMFVFVLLIGSLALLIFFCWRDWPDINIGSIIAIAALGCIIIPVVIVFVLVVKFTEDFVIPIMFIRGCACLEGWSQFLSLLSDNKGNFTLYILFQIVIAMVVSVIILAAVCLTCCIACCLMIIPYIGTVLLLPLLIFHRAYSLMYLRQFGAAFDVFAPPVA